MGWTTPLTAVTNAALTAAQWNASVRDNLLETATAKATAAGQHFASTGANAVAARQVASDRIGTLQSTSSTSFTDLATYGPAVTVTSGAFVFVNLFCYGYNGSAGQSALMGYDVTGATSISASDIRSILTPQTATIANVAMRCGMTVRINVTSGVNNYIAKYRSSSGGTATFQDREISVVPY